MTGDSSVFPGVSQPWSADLNKAINHALSMMHIFENVTDSDHIPPEYLWPFDDEIKEWFENIRAEMNLKSGSGGGDESSVVQNEHAERFSR